MARLQRNLASKTNNFEQQDKDLGYMIWIVEREFHTGPITDDFLVMKFWNLFDDYNIKRNKKEQDELMKSRSLRG